jgi:hypothetical protein
MADKENLAFVAGDKVAAMCRGENLNGNALAYFKAGAIG